MGGELTQRHPAQRTGHRQQGLEPGVRPDLAALDHVGEQEAGEPLADRTDLEPIRGLRAHDRRPDAAGADARDGEGRPVVTDHLPPELPEGRVAGDRGRQARGSGAPEHTEHESEAGAGSHDEDGRAVRETARPASSDHTDLL